MAAKFGASLTGLDCFSIAAEHGVTDEEHS
jgi:hypothetical protein